MPIVTEMGLSFRAAGDAARGVAPRMARRLAEYHRDRILQEFTRQPGGRAGPSNDTFALHDSTRVEQEKSRNSAARIDALVYWKFVWEFGAYLEVPARRINPPRIVSRTAAETVAKGDELVDTEISLFIFETEIARSVARKKL